MPMSRNKASHRFFAQVGCLGNQNLSKDSNSPGAANASENQMNGGLARYFIVPVPIFATGSSLMTHGVEKKFAVPGARNKACSWLCLRLQAGTKICLFIPNGHAQGHPYSAVSSP